MIDAENQPLSSETETDSTATLSADGAPDPTVAARTRSAGARPRPARADSAARDDGSGEATAEEGTAARPRPRPAMRTRRPEGRSDTSPPAEPAANGTGRSFRLLGADGACVALTLAWLAGAAAYVEGAIGFDNLTSMLPNEIGMFVAGVTAPIILLWFAVAYWRQTAGLAEEIRELRTASEQARAQAQSLAASEQHLRIDTYLKLIDFYLSEMAKHAAILASHTLGLTEKRLDALWSRFDQGDREVFFRLFFELAEADMDRRLAKGIADNPVASRSAHLFTGYWQVFLLQADQIDRGNLMLEAYKNGFLGELTRAVNKALYGSENPFS